jgi:hypothetical protein
MKISEKELRKMIKEAVKKKMAVLKEDRDFTALRNIEKAAANASMTFEQDLVKLLNLVEPDNLPDNVQTMYRQVVNEMEENVIQAVRTAVEKLRKFPRNDGQK